MRESLKVKKFIVHTVSLMSSIRKKQSENEKEDLKERVLLAFKGPRKASLEVEPCLAEVHIMISVRYCTLKVHLFCED